MKSENVNRINDLLKQVSDQNNLILAKCNNMLAEAKPEKLQGSVKVAKEVGYMERVPKEVQYGIFEDAMDWIPDALSLYNDLANIHSAQLDVLMCDSCDDGENVCGLCKVKERLDATVSQLLQSQIKWGNDVRDVDFSKYLDGYCVEEESDNENDQNLLKGTRETSYPLEEEHLGATAEGDTNNEPKTSKCKIIIGVLAVALLVALVTGAFMKRKYIQEKFLDLRQLLVKAIKKPEEPQILDIANTFPNTCEVTAHPAAVTAPINVRKHERAQLPKKQSLRQMLLNVIKKPEEPKILYREPKLPNTCEVTSVYPASTSVDHRKVQLPTQRSLQENIPQELVQKILPQRKPNACSVQNEEMGKQTELMNRMLRNKVVNEVCPCSIKQHDASDYESMGTHTPDDQSMGFPMLRNKLAKESIKPNDTVDLEVQGLQELLNKTVADEVSPLSIKQNDTPDDAKMGFFRRHLTKQQQCFKSVLSLFNLKQMCF